MSVFLHYVAAAADSQRLERKCVTSEWRCQNVGPEAVGSHLVVSLTLLLRRSVRWWS